MKASSWIPKPSWLEGLDIVWQVCKWVCTMKRYKKLVANALEMHSVLTSYMWGAWEEGMQQMAVIEAFTTQRLLVKFVTFGARLPWNLFCLVHHHLSGPFGDLRPTFSQKPSLCGPPLIKISSIAAVRWSRMVLAPTNSASSQSRWLDRSGILGGEGPQKSSWGSHWPWKTGSRITLDVFALDNP